MTLGYRFQPIDVELPEHPRMKAIAKRHRRAALGLYVAASCYAKKHRPGIVLQSFVEDDDPKLVEELVRVGLWLPREDGDWDIFNWEKKSAGRKKSSEPPGASTARVHKHRESKKTANDVTVETVGETVETDPVTPSGTSISISKSSSDLSSAAQKIATGSPGAPDWFAVDAVEMVRMNAGFEVDQVGARWLEYSASRKRKTWSMDAQDAAGWLTNVIRAERRQAAERPKARGAEATKQPYDENAPWLKLPEVG